MGVGSILRARDTHSGGTPNKAPYTHRLFSTLEFARDDVGIAELADEGDVTVDVPEVEREVRPFKLPVAEDDAPTGAWLSDDDIEEW